MNLGAGMFWSLGLSAVAYFVAAFYMKRHLDGMDIPKSMVRSVVIFILAATVSYGVAWLVDLVAA